MKCKTCPRLLTHHDRDAGHKACDVCRGVRKVGASKGIVVSPPKKPKAAPVLPPGESWWTGLTSAELNAESTKRFTR